MKPGSYARIFGSGPLGTAASLALLAVVFFASLLRQGPRGMLGQIFDPHDTDEHDHCHDHGHGHDHDHHHHEHDDGAEVPL